MPYVLLRYISLDIIHADNIFYTISLLSIYVNTHIMYICIHTLVYDIYKLTIQIAIILFIIIVCLHISKYKCLYNYSNTCSALLIAIDSINTALEVGPLANCLIGNASMNCHGRGEGERGNPTD